ncbi:MAG: flippase, partial [Ignavibacteriaceae bacterium]|nr:flippase [Ignavibacteriaceae bacterium]
MPGEDQINTKINFGSEAFKKYFANTGWMFGEKIVRMILAFFVGIYVVRYLGPEQFGLLGYAIGFVGLFSTISTLGLDGIVTRELVKTPHKKDLLLGTAFLLRIIGAVASVSLLAVGLLITQDDSSTIILMFVIASSTFFQSVGIIEYFFQSRVEAKYAVLVQFTGVLLTSAFKLFLILSGASLIYFAAATSLEFLILSVGFIIIYRQRSFNILSWKFSKSLAFTLLSESWPLILSGMVVAVYVKIDQVLIKNIMGNEQNGYYTAAARLCEAWYFIPVAITNSLFPAVINAK